MKRIWGGCGGSNCIQRQRLHCRGWCICYGKRIIGKPCELSGPFEHHRSLSGNDFSEFEICNNLLYLTPSTFQNINLLVRFRHINEDMQVSYVVIDEIHCLSNREHDFIPEYLMLSKFFVSLLNRATFIGFTATANYTIIEDVMKQLSIPGENIFIL